MSEVGSKGWQNFAIVWPGHGSTSIHTRQTAFAVAVVVLSAKMAKADGTVTRDEIDTFKRIFDIPAHEMGDVGRLFDEARQDAGGFEPYAAQIGGIPAETARNTTTRTKERTADADEPYR